MKANKQFEQAHIKVAFSLRLSKTQANILLRLDEESPIPWATMSSIVTLESRGLVSYKRDKTGKVIKFNGLTEAGVLVAQLLRMAGMTVANTNPASVLKR